MCLLAILLETTIQRVIVMNLIRTVTMPVVLRSFTLHVWSVCVIHADCL